MRTVKSWLVDEGAEDVDGGVGLNSQALGDSA